MTTSGNGFEDSTPRETRLKYIASGRGRRPSIYSPAVLSSLLRKIEMYRLEANFYRLPLPPLARQLLGAAVIPPPSSDGVKSAKKFANATFPFGIACGFRIVLTGGT